jgi:hypothetical protein
VHPFSHSSFPETIKIHEMPIEDNLPCGSRNYPASRKNSPNDVLCKC